jgi:membrane protein DedA with SNARE-associated domain
MNIVTELHGVAAVAIVCGLLFLDEAGIPLPLVPSEVLLLLTGLFIASGQVPAEIFLPLTTIAMWAGCLAGYTWARTLGQAALTALAEKVGAADALDRASTRLASAGALGIGVARLIPGIRPYITLAAGTAEVPLRRFLAGAIPAIVVWEAVWVALGMLVGLPAAHYLSKVERVALRGGLLLALGLLAYIGLRRATRGLEIPTHWVPRHGRRVLAASINGAMVACIVAGILALTRVFLHLHFHHWIDVAVIALAATVYFLLNRDEPRVTPDGVLLHE